MHTREKLPKLVNIYRSNSPLARRQLPLVVDECLTLVMDVRSSGLIYDNVQIRSKELDEFTKKWASLTATELRTALRVTKSELMHVLDQNVPCVGCRRSVERLYYQLKSGHLTLDPIILQSTDGSVTVRDEKQTVPHVLCSIFHQHSSRLAKLVENQPKRSKKSFRCLLHSLEVQRNRLLTPVWRDVWDCMQNDCRKDVCIIDATLLSENLETYLRKHRFCGECRTKVLRAYALLMDEPEPIKEKGYIPGLYTGIKRCLPDKHIHLPMRTDYITKLIGRAESELLGSRRERHAKTLEIAQEEVLTCLGICMYDRLHRIYLRMREEECMCQLFAAVAVDTLSRSFDMAVEKKRGVTQLDLVCAELSREEHQKQIRKEQKKIKRKRRKHHMTLTGSGADSGVHNNAIHIANSNNNNQSGDGDDDNGDEDDDDDVDDEEEEEIGLDNTVDSTVVVLAPVKVNCQCQHAEEGITAAPATGTLCKCAGELASGKLLTVLTKNRDGVEGGSDHSHDCGYSSETTQNGCCETGSLVSSISSSPEGSDLACFDLCCHHEDFHTFHCQMASSAQHPSLQDMLMQGYSDEDDDNCDSKLTPEEVWEFENSHKQLFTERQELRNALRERFIAFCSNGGLFSHHHINNNNTNNTNNNNNLFTQSKFASN